MNKRLKKYTAVALALCMNVCGMSVFAEGSTPPPKPAGDTQGAPQGNPPAKPDGDMQPPQGGQPGNPPEGMPGNPPEGGMPGGPGGQSSKPDSYDAVNSYDSDADVSGETITSTGKDENAVNVSGGNVTVENSTVERASDESTGGDSSSFYGVGAALLATGGTLSVKDSTVTTDSEGGAGVFAYGDAIVSVSDTTISTKRSTSGGIHAAGGGTLYAKDLTVTTEGGSSAAIRSDRGGGTMVVDGGSYTAGGSGSPAVYVTADITVHNAELTATGSEALCLEGLNSVKLYDCTLTGNMPDLDQNDNTWTVILYQSMSGDAQVGEGKFEMEGGKLVSGNGGLFYTTNTESTFLLNNVEIERSADSEYFLRCTGNANSRGWGASGANGADCTLTAVNQRMEGDVIWDSISSLTLYATQGSTLLGAVLDDESCAGEGGSGTATLLIDADSKWTVTGDSRLTNLVNLGTIEDTEGNTVTIQDTDGNVLVQGTGACTITVNSYVTEGDLSGAAETSTWSDDLMAGMAS